MKLELTNKQLASMSTVLGVARNLVREQLTENMEKGYARTAGYYAEKLVQIERSKAALFSFGVFPEDEGSAQ